MVPDQKYDKHPVVLFDGICNFCSDSVLFIIKRDPSARFRFAALQAEGGRRITEEFGIYLAGNDSIILVENKRIYYRSEAALRIARRLRGAWKLFYVFIIVPPFIRDFFYDIFARNRYRWFGRRDICFIPDEGIKPRFL
jgi:predicted DCC family thiol-disulfide oxidoreductase YuxK